MLALLALQLLMCALILPPAVRPLAQGRGAKALAVLLLGVGCAAWLVYQRHWRWRLALPLGALATLAAPPPWCAAHRARRC